MTFDFFRLQLLLATFAGWVNRHEAQAIEYLVEENRVLKEQMRGRRLRLTDAQRRRLASKGRRLGRRLLFLCRYLPRPLNTGSLGTPGYGEREVTSRVSNGGCGGLAGGMNADPEPGTF